MYGTFPIQTIQIKENPTLSNSLQFSNLRWLTLRSTTRKSHLCVHKLNRSNLFKKPTLSKSIWRLEVYYVCIPSMYLVQKIFPNLLLYPRSTSISTFPDINNNNKKSLTVIPLLPLILQPCHNGDIPEMLFFFHINLPTVSRTKTPKKGTCLGKQTPGIFGGPFFIIIIKIRAEFLLRRNERNVILSGENGGSKNFISWPWIESIL